MGQEKRGIFFTREQLSTLEEVLCREIVRLKEKREKLPPDILEVTKIIQDEIYG